MSCLQCSSQYNLGLHKPIKLCCSTLCYSCAFLIKSQVSHCPTCHSPLPSLDSLQIDSQLIEELWNSSVYRNKLIYSPETHPSGQCSLCTTAKSTKSFSKSKNGLCDPCSNNYLLYKTPVEDLRCIKGHRFVHSDSDVYTPTKCSLCAFQVNTITHCLYCNIHICRICSETLKAGIDCLRFLSCECSGQLVWQSFEKCKSCSVCKEGNSVIGRFLCLGCNKKFCFFCVHDLFEHLKCVVCCQDLSAKNKPVVRNNNELICEPCSEGLSGISVHTELTKVYNKTCKGDHRLSHTNECAGKCDVCNASNKGTHYCLDCQLLLCSPCHVWVNSTTPAVRVRCLRGHYPRLTLTSSEFYKNQNPVCRTCRQPCQECSIFCKGCFVDQCIDCYEFMNTLRTQKITFLCQCTGKYGWVYNKACEKCANCLNNYKNSGSFVCKTCGRGICVPCAKVLTSSLCGVCKSSGANGEISLKQLPCGHFLCFVCYEAVKTSPLAQCPIDQTTLSDSQHAAPSSPVCQVHNFIQGYPEKTTCGICKKAKNGLYYCSDCFFVACENCKIWHIESAPITEGLTCYKGHDLRLTPKAERFYDRKGKFLCDGCDETTHGTSAHCLECKTDYCENCFLNIKMIRAFFEIFRCLCKGRVEWNAGKAGEKCSKCKKKYSKAGFFCCDGCKKIWCIKCAIGVRKENCNICNKLFLKKGVQPVLAITGQVVCEGCLKTINQSLESIS